MSRLSHALKRAREAPADSPAAGAARVDDRVRFFAGEGATVPVPWGFTTASQKAAAALAPHPAASTATPPLHELPRALELVGAPAIAGVVREQYNRLAATLHHTQLERGLKVVLVTSADAGEGKTLTAANLAVTLSDSYRRMVLAVDADLTRPSLHAVFGVPNVSGLGDLLSGNGSLPFNRLSTNLSLLTAGVAGPDRLQTLTSARMRACMEEARATFDWVLIDTPPLGLLPDASLLASIADGAVLVVAAGRTRCDAAQRAAETLGRGRIVSVVLNGVDPARLPRSEYYEAFAHR
jgi:capsular exopolysaccharide synthesis family protein